ncbi:SARP family transcriptional regulator [Streptomyces sulfonofaciens]|uniref:SARP family transcriptional regulator n=1 Tax=Streptomyces sulfonofaciens TaxID=68272 RepID=A0A919GS12_9ACTN|nr:BTAD domain-containing putative transcriptional regulator [Streptomyces sulfonofaciens]GHH89073.1 SARP family transcriptional regulator [Streptomyces sulfonofaciens]
MNDSLRFVVLGRLRAWRGDEEIDLGSPQQQVTLALLLLREERAVTARDIADAIWGDRAPHAALGTVRTYIHRLRRVLARESDKNVIRSADSGGYRMVIDPAAVDALCFRSEINRAAVARAAGNVPGAASHLRSALALWQGDEPLAGMHGRFVQIQREQLVQARSEALEKLCEAHLELGQHTVAVEVLQRAVLENPLREKYHELLMMALYQQERQAEALLVYERARRILADELGMDPGPALTRLHQRILRSEAIPLPQAPACVSTQSAAPAQLPADLPVFVGRDHELNRVASLVPGDVADWPRGPRVCLITGPAAVGKTTFAVRLARRVAARFPDGQLYVDLRGYDREVDPVDPGEVICGFLDALGVPPHNVPTEPHAQAARYRSVLADRRVLIVLDNARDTEQVIPVLPGGAGCFVLVTSRSNLPGLVSVTSAHVESLGLLSHEESVEILTKRIGAARVTAEPEAVRTIVESCVRLPLALAIAAARAVTHPEFPLGSIAGELTQTQDNLDAFVATDGSHDVRAVLSWSYRALSSDAARLFRLLALHSGPDISLPGASSIAGRPERTTHLALRELADSHLLLEEVPGRYTRHDLLRAYAMELLDEAERAETRHAALRRMLDYYLHSAIAADVALSLHRDMSPPPSLDPPVNHARFKSYGEAMRWFSFEYPTLRGLVEQAAAAGLPDHAWRLAWALRHYQDRQGHWDELAVTQQIALNAATELGDRTALAYAHRGLARAESQHGRYDSTAYHLERARELFEEEGDMMGLAYTLRQSHWLFQLTGDIEQAQTQAVRALELFRAEGWHLGEAAALGLIGWGHVLHGSAQDSLSYSRAAQSRFHELGERYGEASAFEAIGLALHRLGSYDAAIRNYRRAIEMFHELGGRRDEIDVMLRLSETNRAAGQDHEYLRSMKAVREARAALGAGSWRLPIPIC